MTCGGPFSGPTVHLLTQFAWPDSAPTALLAELLADRLQAEGMTARLVAGAGAYRESTRPPPATPLRRLNHWRGNRRRLGSTAREYFSVTQTFRRYLRAEARLGDVVIVTSAPPTTTGLWREIRAVGARPVYWLQDYYPELLRTIWDYPRWLRRLVAARWDRSLACWERVVKIGANLGYDGPNAAVIRNWPTHDLGPERAFIPKTALYSGNLGWCHHLPSLFEACEGLRRDGFAVTFRGDGRGMDHLPGWIQRGELLRTDAALVEAYWQAEVHLVAAHPEFRRAVFPSKFWNSRATGRRLVCTGFAGECAAELAAAQATDPATHLDRWVELVVSLLPAKAT